MQRRTTGLRDDQHDSPSRQEVHNYRKQDQLFHMIMHLPCALAAVSPAVDNILGGQFR